MSASTENDSEILLGNRQLLAVFGVVAVLLAVAFTGGYMVGKNSAEKKTTVDANAAQGDAGALTTRTVPPAGAGDATTSDAKESVRDAPAVATTPPSDVTPEPSKSAEPPLGSRKHPDSAHAEPPSGAEATTPLLAFTPESGQTFLQVAAVGKDEADAVAEVLHKQGYRAHSVPKPGNAKIFRVLIGPLKDAGDLATTRDALRKTGFREVITQHY